MLASRNPELAQVIGRRIARMRIARGESQEEVSLRSGIHRTAIGQLERGERIPRADTLVKVAGALEVDSGALISGLRWNPISYIDGGFDYGAESGGAS
jgi:transcriptional regulator with XRE-family HTH domain